MKVLMTTMQLDIGGAETHIVELSKALARRGIDVSVASNGGAYEAELTDAGIRHFKVPFHSKNPSAMFKSYNRLKQIILKNNFDVVHAHARIPAFLCGLLKKQINFRFVTTAHWVFSTKFPYNILTKWGDRSLSVSDDIKLYLVDNYGINPSNIRVTINGIDTSKFSKSTDYSDVAREFDLKPNMTRIVYVSRMDVDRSYAAHKLIDIAADLNSQIKDLEILIVGGGNDYTNIVNEAEAVNKDLGRRLIITTGSRTDINKFIASGDIFVGVSRAALEAMAAEVPSIIAGNEGYIGIFDEDKLQVSIDTNFCCRGMGETTSEQLKRDILTLLTATADERSRLGKYSQDTINNHYSINTMADDAMKMYVSIIKNSDINLVSNDEFDDIDNFITPLYNGKRKTDVMISGYYGFNNSGDDSILRAIVDSLLEIKPDIDIIALSKNPTETESIYGIKSIHRFNVFRIFWRLLHTKLLISGGGSLIQDITSDKSLAYYLGIINIAKLAGAKV
ncbi:MAG: glycosyltransferase, partial [Oscillospiraceae bacterium]